MATGDGEADGGAIPLPRRPESDAPVVTLRSAGRGATALLETVVPPWLRVPPVDPRPALRSVDGSRRTSAAAAPSPTTAEPGAATDAPVVRRPPRPADPDHRPLRARPRVEPEAGIIGLSRLTRTRVGSRLFALFFVAVFALIFVQMCVVLVRG